MDEAIAIFQKNAKDHPDSWNVHDSLGEALATKGDKKAAADSYAKALNLTTRTDNPLHPGQARAALVQRGADIPGRPLDGGQPADDRSDRAVLGGSLQ